MLFLVSGKEIEVNFSPRFRDEFLSDSEIELLSMEFWEFLLHENINQEIED